MVVLLRQGLEEEGHEVLVCHSGRVPLRQDELEHFDVILLDWSLPGQDGVSVLRQWRETGLQTPVLMLTARGTTGGEGHRAAGRSGRLPGEALRLR